MTFPDSKPYEPTPEVADGSFYRWLCETGYYKRPMVYVGEMPDESVRIMVGLERTCLDCPARLANWRHGEIMRCKSCASKKREADLGRTKKIAHCADCGRELSRTTATRCNPCSARKREAERRLSPPGPIKPISGS